MSVFLCARQRHGLKAGLFLVALVSLQEPVNAADPAQADQARLSSLEQRIDELNQAGKYRDAIPVAQERLQLVEKTVGPDQPETGAACDKLGDLYFRNGDYAKAQPLCERGLRIREKALGLEHPAIAASLNTLAQVHARVGDYAGAEPLFQRALKIREKALGPEDPETARSLNNLAALYDDIGDYAKAEPLFQRAIKIREKALGPEHSDTAKSLNGLANLYDNIGDFAKAEPLRQRTLRIWEKTLGPEHPNTALSLNNLANLYAEMGDYAKAEPLFQLALKIRQKALGADHPDTADSLNNLAEFYCLKGDYGAAEPLYQRALEIREKAMGPEHFDTAYSLDSLAVLYAHMGDYARAEPLGQRALKIREKALGPEHPDTALSLYNLAVLYDKMGNYAKAEPLLRRALRIREKVIGRDHPDTARALNHLAFLEIDLGKAKGAIPLLAEARRAEEKHLSNMLSFTSESQRLEFQKTADPYSLAAALGSASDLAELVLRHKGVVLDSLLEDRLVAEASGDPKQHLMVDELRSAKQRLTKLVMEVPQDLSEQARQQHDAEKEKLSTQVEQLEAGLARQVAGLGRARRALSVTVAQVQSALPQSAVLIELLRYLHYLGNTRFELRYGAIVIGASGEPTWVPLGTAAEIEENVAIYQKSVRGKTDEAMLVTVLRLLKKRIWTPIEKAVPAGTAMVIVSPDAELSFVSFATLLTDDDRFIGEKYSVRYVASGRDLLRETKATADPKVTMQVFANPDFGGSADNSRNEKTHPAALRSVEMRDLQGISLPKLPGTERESAELEARARKSGWQSQAYLGANATEAELRRADSPRILHLATHGFFLPEIDFGRRNSAGDAAEIPKGKLVNAMHRSGLALAGAQTTLLAWAKGEIPPSENDGIVTAEEVGGLKLDGTWLVVLSACDTGGGEARAGEGVMGLRRGFIQAGAQNLLMTLWPISDETTVQIMLDFYDAALKGGNAPQALVATQRNWLIKLRKERGLLEAARLAGPFIMSSQGKQK